MSDLGAEWSDPEVDRPHGAPAAATPHRAALDNPRATPVAITHATIMTAAGGVIDDGTIVLDAGYIVAVGAHVGIPADAQLVDGTGRFVTPGIIDAHSHLGVYAAPSVGATDDGNEATSPVTAQSHAEYAYWPQDPQISRALAGGVTTAQILPGSANLVGGRGFIVQMKPGRTTAEVAFPGAPMTVKMACGENPKRVYGEKGGPQTRMGEYAAFRAAFAEAAAYQAKRTAYLRARARWEKQRAVAAFGDAHRTPGARKSKPIAAPDPVPVDDKLETLAAILRGDALVQIHCYKASDMAQMMAIADEAGFHIRSFHHALEAYKIRDQLIAAGIAINTWADWWGFKMEALDGIPENAALFTEQGGRATIHSDSPQGIQRLNQEAAKAAAAGRAAGVTLTDDQVLRWITANPAWVLGIDDVTGTLEVGKRADVVLWSASPFSVYSRADMVWIAGERAYQRSDGLPASDYELGNSATLRNTAPRRTP